MNLITENTLGIEMANWVMCDLLSAREWGNLLADWLLLEDEDVDDNPFVGSYDEDLGWFTIDARLSDRVLEHWRKP